MNEERLTNLKQDFACVECRTERFFNRTNILLDEVSSLIQALEGGSSVGDSVSSPATVSQLASSIVRRI